MSSSVYSLPISATPKRALQPYWRPIRDKYKPKQWIGKGASGEVVRARNRVTNEVVAIKMIELPNSKEEARPVLREIEILKQLSQIPSNVHTIKLKEVIVKEGRVFLVTDYIQQNLDQFLEAGKVLDYATEHNMDPDAVIKKILYGLLSALDFLHSAKVVHRDIKPANILIDNDLNIKLCDFGLARTLSEEEAKAPKRRLSTHVVTRPYRPPEVILLEKKYGFSVDVWSAGCVLAELMAMSSDLYDAKENRILFRGDSCYPLSPFNQDKTVTPHDQMRTILQILGRLDQHDLEWVTVNKKYLQKLLSAVEGINRVDFDKEFFINSTQLTSILNNTLSFNPDRRESAHELLNHPFFDGVRESRFEQAPDRQLKVDDFSLEKCKLVYGIKIDTLGRDL